MEIAAKQQQYITYDYRITQLLNAWQDPVALANALTRIFRYGVKIGGLLTPIPAALLRTAHASYFLAVLRLPMTSTLLVEDLSKAIREKKRCITVTKKQVANRIGALSAQCFQLYKGCHAFLGFNPLIPPFALAVFGLLGICFAALSVYSHGKAIAACCQKLNANSHLNKQYTYKMFAHSLSACSTVLNVAAIGVIQVLGAGLPAYLLLGYSAALSVAKYSWIKPQAVGV